MCKHACVCIWPFCVCGRVFVCIRFCEDVAPSVCMCVCVCIYASVRVSPFCVYVFVLVVCTLPLVVGNPVPPPSPTSLQLLGIVSSKAWERIVKREFDTYTTLIEMADSAFAHSGSDFKKGPAAPVDAGFNWNHDA